MQTVPTTVTCTEPGCTARPYGLNSVLRDPVPTCKAHTPCSEPGCTRMVGKGGCAPAELGRPLCSSHYSRWQLYGSTAEHTRKQRADKGSYRVPDRVEDSVAGHPVLATMFIRNLDIPGRAARETALRAINLCEWSCPEDPTHPHFAAKVGLLMRAGLVVTRTRGDGTEYQYTYPPISCPECSNTRRPDARRRTLRARLAHARPELAAQFKDNLTRPGSGLEALQPRSTDLVRWTCLCGAEVDKRPCAVPRGSLVLCRGCKRTGQSLLEWQVAALVELSAGVVVDRQHVELGRRVDLWVPAVGMGFDLDPHYTHWRPERLAGDQRKSQDLAAVDYRRVREQPLGKLCDQDVLVPAGAPPWMFAKAILDVLVDAGCRAEEITAEIEAEATARARADWVRSGPTLRELHPDRVALVVRCADQPELDWAMTPLRVLVPLRFEVRCPDPSHRPRTVVLGPWLRTKGGCRWCPKARPTTPRRIIRLTTVPGVEAFRRLRDEPEVPASRIGRTSRRVGVFTCTDCSAEHELPVRAWVLGERTCGSCAA